MWPDVRNTAALGVRRAPAAFGLKVRRGCARWPSGPRDRRLHFWESLRPIGTLGGEYKTLLGGLRMFHALLARRLFSRPSPTPSALQGWFTIDVLSILPYDSIGCMMESDSLKTLKAPPSGSGCTRCLSAGRQDRQERQDRHDRQERHADLEFFKGFTDCSRLTTCT